MVIQFPNHKGVNASIRVSYVIVEEAECVLSEMH